MSSESTPADISATYNSPRSSQRPVMDKGGQPACYTPQTPRPSAPPPQERRHVLRDDGGTDFGVPAASRPPSTQVYSAYPSGSVAQPKNSNTPILADGSPQLYHSNSVSAPSQNSYAPLHQHQQMNFASPHPHGGGQMGPPSQLNYASKEDPPLYSSNNSAEITHQNSPQMVPIQQSISLQNTAFQIQQRSSGPYRGNANMKIQRIHHIASQNSQRIDEPMTPQQQPISLPSQSPMLQQQQPHQQQQMIQKSAQHGYIVAASPQQQHISNQQQQHLYTNVATPASNKSNASCESFQQSATPDNFHRNTHFVKDVGSEFLQHHQLQDGQIAVQDYHSQNQQQRHQQPQQVIIQQQINPALNPQHSQQVVYRAHQQNQHQQQLYSQPQLMSGEESSNVVYINDCANRNVEGVVGEMVAGRSAVIQSSQQQPHQQPQYLQHQQIKRQPSQTHYSAVPGATPILSQQPVSMVVQQQPIYNDHQQQHLTKIVDGNAASASYVLTSQHQQQEQLPHQQQDQQQPRIYVHQQLQQHVSNDLPQQQQMVQINGKTSVQQPLQQQIFISNAPTNSQQPQGSALRTQLINQQLISEQQQVVHGVAASALPHNLQQQSNVSIPMYIGSQRFYMNSLAAAQKQNHATAAAGVAPLSLSQDVASSANLKSMYRDLKRKFKFLVYENEYYQEDLRNLQRKLLKLSRDKNFLLDRLQGYEPVSDSSDDSDASAKTVEDRPQKARRRTTASTRSTNASVSTGGRKRNATVASAVPVVNGTAAAVASALNRRSVNANLESNDHSATNNTVLSQHPPAEVNVGHAYENTERGVSNCETPRSIYQYNQANIQTQQQTQQVVSACRTSSALSANHNNSGGEFLASKTSAPIYAQDTAAGAASGSLVTRSPIVSVASSNTSSRRTSHQQNVQYQNQAASQSVSSQRRRNTAASGSTNHNTVTATNISINSRVAESTAAGYGNHGSLQNNVYTTSAPSTFAVVSAPSAAVRTTDARMDLTSTTGNTSSTHKTVFVSCAAPPSLLPSSLNTLSNNGSVATENQKESRRASSDANFQIHEYCDAKSSLIKNEAKAVNLDEVISHKSNTTTTGGGCDFNNKDKRSPLENAKSSHDEVDKNEKG